MDNILNCMIYLTGVVQGVGFRPFVYRTANYFGLKGRTYNETSILVTQVEGKEEIIKSFLRTILSKPPALARIQQVKIRCLVPQGFENFLIEESTNDLNSLSFVSPDVAVCDKCIEDINNKVSQRFLYPFTNCTECGPRYSVLRHFPYDRENTTMAVFDLCEQCQEEYLTPWDRRFHAQTNCCEKCGPNYDLLSKDGAKIKCNNSIKKAIDLLSQGKIIAIKGIGGYHLCCDAQDKETVEKLRVNKKRPHKPLAIMVADLKAVRTVCHTSTKEEEILTSPQRPIVLIRKKDQDLLPENIAPNQKYLGMILPYTPLHFLFFQSKLKFLVMTSGNISSMPICYQDQDALKHLHSVADYFLIHNREIHTPVDDSVVRVFNEQVLVNRCGRGYAPTTLQINSTGTYLALGAEQKSAICLTRNGYAYLSQYTGDLKNYDTFNCYSSVIDKFQKLFDTYPEKFVHDLNKDYLSSKYCNDRGGQHITVQHHHAHMAGCMAENGLRSDVIGIVFDGTGLGTDGAVWGGEFFTGSLSDYRREGHLKYVILQGGDSLVKEPWKSAVCYTTSMEIDPWELLPDIDYKFIKTIKNALHHSINCCKSSSMGRLFDCVAALTGVRSKNTYDAQAAIELESQIDDLIEENYPYQISEDKNGFILEYEDIILGVIRDVREGHKISIISSKFHNSIVKASVDIACAIRKKSGINNVILSGGVFENNYLLSTMYKSLKNQDFNVYYHRQVPFNDGGIAFGQAAVACAMEKDGL